MATAAAPQETAIIPRWRRWLRRFLVVVCMPYLIVVALLATFQRSLIYHPRPVDSVPLTVLGTPGPADEAIIVTTDDGILLHGWWLGAKTTGNARAADGSTSPGANPLVLYFCGNAGDRSHRYREFDILRAAGADVLCCDYRGYAENAGSPSEEGLALDARAVWKYATENRNVPPAKIILFGESLGGGVAVRLASEACSVGSPPGGLIARSTFSSLSDVAQLAVPWLPSRWMLVDRFPSEERIRSVTSPLLVLHGRLDTIVPFELGRKLFDAAPKDSTNGYANRFVELPAADHNDVLEADGARFGKAVRELIEHVASQ